MLALRYAYLLALATWLGGMLVLGALVAPSTFQILQAIQPIGGRALAGDVFGAILTRFHFVAYAAGGVMLLTLTAMALLGPRPTAYAVRMVIVSLMLAAAIYSGFIVLNEIGALQVELGGLASSLPVTDVRRIRFDELHQLSTRLMFFDIAGALALLFWEAKER